jgi:CO/xanthine dehydrogenase Mo-binding subunit
MCWSSAKSTCSPTLIANAVHHVTGIRVRDLPIALAKMLQ